jgi:hypothetical protein
MRGDGVGVGDIGDVQGGTGRAGIEAGSGDSRSAIGRARGREREREKMNEQAVNINAKATEQRGQAQQEMLTQRYSGTRRNTCVLFHQIESAQGGQRHRFRY